MKKIFTFLLLQSISCIFLFAGVRNKTLVFLQLHNTELNCFKSDTAYRIIKSVGKTYGYEILINSKTVIRQLNIPGVAGTNGFRIKKDAEKIAQLVIKKMRLGLMPPSIEKMELDRLKINY